MTPDEADAPRIRLTATQAQRLRELGADPQRARASSSPTRADARRGLQATRGRPRAATAGAACRSCAPASARAAAASSSRRALRDALTGAGFVQVVTPLIIAADALRKMGIEHGHPLREQVFWLEDGRCLRPMLAPNLYTLLRRLGRIWSRPFGIFEIGPCFRRDSKGASHLNEFTMLNLVELGRPRGRVPRAARGAGRARHGTPPASTTTSSMRTDSEVYGEMVDVEVERRRGLLRRPCGPHPLDGNWGIVDPWVGLGFGLERLLMAREGYPNIERAGRSLSYVDGVRLNL